MSGDPQGVAAREEARHGSCDSLDHGLLNVPLSKRGNIDAQIDRYKLDQARFQKQEDTSRYHRARAMKAEIKAMLDQLPDERVLELAAPLGKRKANTARAALASAADSNLMAWAASLQREVEKLK